MNTICLVLDCLHAGFLGPYGNTWIRTPAFDLLASQAFTFDCALVHSPRLDVLYGAYWQTSQATGGGTGRAQASLPTRLRMAGFTSMLMTDDRCIARHPLAGEFDRLIAIDRNQERRIAEQLDETHFAFCFAQLVDWLEKAPEGFSVWCHLGGLGTLWDAPMEYRGAYTAPGDPEPYSATEPPAHRLPTDYDPDELFGIVQAYAGQVSLLDACLGGLMRMLEDCSLGDDTAVIVLGARGFPLGEHLRVGLCDLPLYSELVHVPAIIRLPDGCGAAARSPALMQPADIFATLLDIVGSFAPEGVGGSSLLPVIRGERDWLRDCIVLGGAGGQCAVRTPSWYFRAGQPPELYTKPDDRWEANNVASRCGEVVDQLRSVLLKDRQMTEPTEGA